MRHKDESDRLSACKRPKGWAGPWGERGVWMSRTHRADLLRLHGVRRGVVAVLVAAMMMSQVPAPAYAAALDATANSAAGAEQVADEVEVAIAAIGPDANGASVSWASSTSLKLKAGATAADASEELFRMMGWEADYGIGSWGWYLNSITSPYTGEQLGFNATSGAYWQLFVNGVSSEVGAGDVTLASGDVVTWAYAAYGSSIPDVSPVTPVPDAPRPSWPSVWPGYGSGSNVLAATPTGAVQERWVSQIKETTDWSTNISDPIVVGDYLYLAKGSSLLQVNAATGEVVREGALVAPIDSTARMVYTNGIVIVPLSGGRLQALTADSLVTTWFTPELPKAAGGQSQQALTTLTLGNGCVYYGTAVADVASSYGGYLSCVNTSTGAVVWTQERVGCGYYWAGAALSGSYLVIGDDAGVVAVRDVKTGNEVSRVDMGAPVRSTVVAAGDGSTLFAVSSDGVLHRLALGMNGTLTETGRVSFAKSSTCTPAVVDGKLYVGGMSDQFVQVSKYVKAYRGVLAVIDVNSLSVDASVTTVDGAPFVGSMSGNALTAEVKSSPVVSVQNGETYVYVTANCNPGGVYRYRVGDADATLMYSPDAAHQNYCMASVTVGPDGTLYYVNDSGALFAIGSKASNGDNGDGGNNNGGDNGGSDNDNGGSGNNGSGNGGSGNGGSNDGGQGNQGQTGAGDSTATGSGGTPTTGNQPNGAAGAAGAPAVSTVKPKASSDTASSADADESSKDDDAQEKNKAHKDTDGSNLVTGTASEDLGDTDADAAQGAPVAMLLPVAGIIVGASGLVAIGVWLMRRRVR